MKEYTYAYCWFDGLIEFGQAVPEGALAVARAPKGNRKLRTAVSTWAIPGDDGKTLLVPGMPTAKNPYYAMQAVKRFIDLVAAELPKEEQE